MVTVSELLARNEATLANYTPRPTNAEMMEQKLPLPDTVIVTCADARIIPEEFFGLKSGETLIFRTVGGRVRPIIQDLVSMDGLFGQGVLKQILIVHHTSCGGSMVTVAQSRERMIAIHPDKKDEIMSFATPSWDGRSIEDSVRDDVEEIKESKWISEAMKEGARGFIIDITTGKVSEVV